MVGGFEGLVSSSSTTKKEGLDDLACRHMSLWDG